MRRSLSHPTGPFPAPDEEEPVASIGERDPIWLEGLTYDQYCLYYRAAYTIAYRIVVDPYEAEVVADRVMDELREHKESLSEEEIRAYLRRLAWSRATDCLRSRSHRWRRMFRPWVQKDEDGEEYEAVPGLHCSRGAEEEFFYEEERERFAQRFAQAVRRLNDLQRACFVLRVVEGLKSEEIAELLHVPAEVVHTQTYRARNRIAKLLGEQEERVEKHGKRGKGSS